MADRKLLSIGIQADFLGNLRENPDVVISPVLTVLHDYINERVGFRPFVQFDHWLVVFRLAGLNDFGGGRGAERPELDRDGAFLGIDFVVPVSDWLPHVDSLEDIRSTCCEFYSEAVRYLCAESKARGEEIDFDDLLGQLEEVLLMARAGEIDEAISSALTLSIDEYYDLSRVLFGLKEDPSDPADAAGPEAWRPKRPHLAKARS